MDGDVHTDQKGPHTPPYAPLTETERLRLARCVVEDGRPLSRAAKRFQQDAGRRTSAS